MIRAGKGSKIPAILDKKIKKANKQVKQLSLLGLVNLALTFILAILTLIFVVVFTKYLKILNENIQYLAHKHNILVEMTSAAAQTPIP